ncbi:hypothetical protein CW689_01360 [Macrococcoides caseolyticum]|uniref:YopX family protein n=1 Tax=Macrococcoides caseolyticum TaxID=69966 RepID=UPI000C346DCD|nr:YopX family protein [Macrococcus caseolyticus]PKE25140.1 hypothetical protein CW689_01360 [Macrococcus caseolyticus]
MIPKFRAWDKKVKEMLEVENIDFVNETLFLRRETEFSTSWVELNLNNVALMQSTGIHDVNAKEIFEGDIVKVSQDDDYFISFVKNMIEFDYPGFDVPFPDDWDYECNVLSHLMNTDQTIEVIGNIHEHPELLERDGE